MTWQKLGTETLTGTSDEINILEFAASTFLFVLTNAINSGVIGLRTRVGTTTIDTGSNYAIRISNNGGTDSTSVNVTNVDFAAFDQAVPNFQIVYGINISDEEKLFIAFSMNGQASGAGTAPQRSEAVGKWVNTAAQLQSWRSYNASTGDFATNSNLSVLGSDVAVVEDTFASLYESFQELTSIQVSHFVEWFSGDSLDAIWTQHNETGSNTFAMADEIDGGFKITTGTSFLDEATIYFNNKRHYDPRDCELIAISKSDSADHTIMTGMSNLNDPISDGTAPDIGVLDETIQTHFQADSSDGSVSLVAMSIVIDNDYHIWKITCGSANIKYFADGVLEVTKTTNRPTQDMQPVLSIFTRENPGAASTQITYMEIYNTSVSISSSLYERLSALTQVMNQRVVETFSGALLNERWIETGLGTATMDDTIDGGCIINSDSSQQAGINFNNIRQYNFDDTVLIGVWKRGGSATSQYARCGLINASASSNFVYMREDVNNTNKSIRSADGSTSSETEGSVPVDTSFHVTKLVLSSSDLIMYVDGVLDVTKTTNRPTLKMQPDFNGAATGVISDCSIRYLEAYNKLSTETDFPSVYELFNPLTTIANQHFWEWFDGSDLSNRWTKNTGNGSPTYAMEDSIDGGFSITLGSTGNFRGGINFNNKRQFAPDGSIMIAVWKSGEGTEDQHLVGFSSVTDIPLGLGDSALSIIENGFSFFRLQTSASATATRTSSDISIDTDWHTHKVETTASDCDYYIDGVLKVTNTTNLPAVKMQPYIDVRNNLTGVNSIHIRYFEAFNT